VIRKNFLGKEVEIDCVGCSIAEETFEAPGGFIFQTEHFVLHQDPEIPIEGFFCISSKRHFRYYYEMNSDEQQELSTMIFRAREMAYELNPVVEYSIIFEERSKHFHIWLFPRMEWMNGFPNSLTSVRDIMQFARNHQTSPDQISRVLHVVERAKAIFK
jgi:diadenosine tetraphosphate (Ap4A) HIT family hydrolase